MGDFVKKSIIHISNLQLGVNITGDFNDNCQGLQHLDEFLQNDVCMALCSYLEKDGGLVFSKVPPDFECIKTLVFTKKHPMTGAKEDFFKLLQVNSLSKEPTVDLYQFLNNVFSPQLQKHYDKDVKRKIHNLQSTLKSMIVKENAQRAAIQESDSSLLTYIDSVDDEIRYWSSLVLGKKDKLARKSGDIFIKLLKPIADELNMIEALPSNEVEDLLEKCHNTLDDLWRCDPPFPKDRMKNLMDIIAYALWKHTTKQFKSSDLWLDEYNAVLEKLSQSNALCEKWLGTCKQLTGLFWVSHETNPWKDDVYQPLELVHLADALREVLSIRTVHKQLLRLSTEDEKADLDGERVFKPFKDLEVLAYEADSHDLLKARKEFEYLLQPAEERVGLKLKKQLMTVNANIRQLIYEFTRYSELISRPVLMNILRAERQFLLNSLEEYITQIQHQSNQDNSKIVTRQETPDTIREIIFVRQLEVKTGEVVFVTEKLLNDLDGYERVNDFVVSVLNDLKSQHSELLDAWSSDIISDLKRNKLSLKETDPVVQFSQDKLMKVNYPSRLITLIAEVRQLQAMGYHIPSMIEETSEHAKKFMKYARILEQIANFHNTIGDRMIPSQKPMMLSSALELSKLVQEQEVVPWGEEKHVEKYVNTLKKCVEKLAQSNDLLTSFHIEIIDKIKDLDNVSLIKEYARWNDVIKNIRTIVAGVENKGYKNMQPWKVEIDGKICEVLEAAYTKNLKSMHLSLEEIKVDLVYRNSALDFVPKRETLSQMYDQQLKKYLDIPKNIKGISDSSESIYSKIIERNGAVLDSLSSKKRELFDQLDAVIHHWQSWLQLEPLDPKKLTSWEHWDLHFRASKTFGQEIAKLPSNEERIGCFLIGLSRLRSDLESHNRSYWDQLVYSLKDSIAEDVVKLQNYIDPSTAALTKQPVTMEEIGESGFSYNNIIAAQTEMETVFKELLNKSKTLASWSREQVDSVNRLKGAWERLGSLISNHQHIMARQMETIRTSLGIEQENLLKEIERFEAKWKQINTIHSSFDSNENTIEGVCKLYEEMEAKRKEWNNVIEKKEALYNNYCKFNLEKPDIIIANEVESALKEEEASWALFAEFNTAFESFTSQYWIVFRKKYYELEDFITSWEETFSKHSDQPHFVPVILKDLQKYKDIIPTLKYLKGEDFSDKHWNDVFSLLDIESKAVDKILLKDLLNAHERILNYSKELRSLCKKAASEIVVRQALKDIDQWDVQTKFALNNHTDSHGKSVRLVKEFKEILNAIGDHQILLQSLKHSGNVDTYMEKASNWEVKLENLNFYLNSLAQVQKKWLYLEPIFGSGTLTQEKVRFDRLDRDFRKIMAFIEKDPRVTEICKFPYLKSTLQSISEQLSRCQHSLESFLREKRENFPRFLFLSDDDLLEIVGQSTKEQVIQSHLKKLFAGIHSVQIDSTGDHITAITSLQGEVVRLSNSVDIKRPVEEWLSQLVQEMQSSLKELLVSCQRESQAPDPLKYPSQILCLSDNISFTLKCEQAISNLTLPALLAKYKTQLNELSSLELDRTSNKSEDSGVLEIKLKALLLDTIHHIGVLEHLLDKNVTKITDWVWQKQLRCYANSVGDVTVKMAKARMNYSYEYLGNEQKLVRTPLTERCFLTLTQAMHLGLGGNPYGPAGTGKTESVKALGSILGRQVLVFNCDEGIDVNSMERILTGLVKTGAWGCFDEFNRLDETTLSAISMHIHAIQEALRNNLQMVKVGGHEVSLNKHCGIFVTLNPAGAGYGGRNKLPDNLKQLFRPVVMTHPDHEEIARTSLHCDGYHYADVIASKIVEVFEVSSKILSKQQHYDWGLRAIKTVLAGCGAALRKFTISRSKTLSKVQEMGVVVGTLKMDIVSKLTFSDTVRFNDILGNVFGGVPVEKIDDDVLLKAILESYAELGLLVNERQVNKCLEFHKQLTQRMGVAIIGPPSSGKSTILSLVSRAATKIKQKVKLYPVNPKCMPRQLLLGYMDNLNQWNDGVLTAYSLAVSTENEENIWSWIVCDGDIEPEWVESLNSVLDDNRLMTLPSGWRIHFGANVNFVFETDSLKNASPATISRIGIVYLSSEDINLVDIMNVKLPKVSEEQRLYLQPLLSDYFVKSLNWVKTDGECTMDRSLIATAKTALCQMSNVSTKLSFIVALINGIGCQLKSDFRQEFGERVFEWLDETPLPFLSKLYYDQDRDCIDTYHTDPQITIDDVAQGIPLIKTGQVLKYLDLISTLLEENREEHFLLVGPHGSAKRLILRNILCDRFDSEIVEINCSSNLLTNYIIHKMQQHCISVTTSKGNMLKPRKGKLIMCFRNMHLLDPDRWGSNMAIELLSQLIEYKGYFNSKTEFVQIENVIIVGTLISSRKISSRFLSKIHSINIDLPDKEDLTVILVAYLHAIIKTYHPAVNYPKAKVVKLIATILAVYEKMQEGLTIRPQIHYPLNPHDLIRWCTNLKYYSIADTSQFEVHILQAISYEAQRIFGDRQPTMDQKKRLKSIIDDIFKANWDIPKVTVAIDGVYFVPNSGDSGTTFDKLSAESWQAEVERGINQFGKENQVLDVIINEEILLLTAAVIRYTVVSDYNLVLIGKSGIGRKTSIKICSALRSKRVIHPVSGTYPLFQNDLKSAMQYAGLECEDVMLILEDNIFVTEQNTTAVNLLMSNGEVPDLFSDIEMDSLVKGLKEKLDRGNFEGDLHQFFSNNVKKHLHIFVCLDQDHPNLRDIILKCPAFTQSCGILWLNQWCVETVKRFPHELVQRFGGMEGMSNSDSFQTIYSSFPDVSPVRYISMVKLYFSISKEKESAIKAKTTKLEGGVSKLTEAKTLVSELKQKAAEQQEKLAEKQSKANAALDMISNTIKGANAHKEEMEVLKHRTENENMQLVKRKAEIEEELSEVEPLIQEARAAVGNIKTESLSEIRSLRAPPEIIRDILEGVLKLMGTQDTSWNSMKIFLAKRGVKEDIRSFDASRIRTENRQAVERLMATKKDSFDQKFAKRASVAAAPLAAWVEANVKYSKVLDKIRPLEKEQYKLKENLSSAETQLVELNANLSDVDATVAKLKEQLSQYTKEAAEIEIGLNEVNTTLGSAENLVFKLEDEYQRWQEQLKELSNELGSLSNNSLLAAAFVTFLSEEEDSKRRKTLDVWSKELKASNFEFMSFFSTDREQLQWQYEGLPFDRASLENAVVVKKGILSPLLIDPNSTAVRWLKNHYGKHCNNFDHITFGSPKLNTMLEASIRFGKILLVEELEEVSPFLYPIIRGDFIVHGERKMIRLLGKVIDCHSDFKIIMTTRNEHIQILPEIAPYIYILNFNVTYSGFVEQLLSAAITQEKPDLETRRKQLLHENEELQEKLDSLQSQLLDCLTSSTGNILNNKALLQTLNETKSNSVAVTNALEESTKIQNTLRKEYEVFFDISSFGSRLFFACKEYGKFDVLYSLSATAFSRLFLVCLQATQAQQATPDLQRKHLFQTVYNYMSRGMFKKDRLLFCLHLVSRMFPEAFPEQEMALFLENTSYQGLTGGDVSDLPAWIPQTSMTALHNLKNSFPHIYEKCQFSEKNIWTTFMESSQCENDLPRHCQLTEFQKVLVVQVLRSDQLLSCVESCCLRVSGLRTIDPGVLSLSYIYNESICQEPLLLITTSGMDPSSEIYDLAKQLNHSFEEISMGEGQESKALMTLDECRQSGKWLILKNLQLVPYWLPVLAQNVKHHNSSNNFRLWLISEATVKFNVVLAQNSLKVAYEEPQGLGNNLQRIYSSVGEKYDNKLGRTSARIFFVFSYLHVLLQERRKYIPQGWSQFYEFNQSDMQTGLNLTEDLWNIDSTRVQWQFITGLLEEAVYGGRIERIEDMSILETYLKIYFKDDVLSHKWSPQGVNIALPNTGQNKEYGQVIKRFPNKDQPNMFGLPKNIDKAREKQESLKLIQLLKTFYQKQTENREKKEVNFKELQPIFSLWKRLNQGQDFVRTNLPEDAASFDSAIENFVHEEFAKGIVLIQIIHKCFARFNRILKGALEPDDSDLTLAKQILKNQTPTSWMELWSGPKHAERYITELLQKTIYLETWRSASSGDLLNIPVKLNRFFNPERFLACSKEDFAKKSNISLEELVLQTSWSHSRDVALVLSDLLIEGALIENKLLKECDDSSESINVVPSCYLSWVRKARTTNDDLINFALYANSRRDYKIANIQVQCDATLRDQYILSGVAFYLNY